MLLNTILSQYFSSGCVLFLKDDFANIGYLEEGISIVNVKVKNYKVPPELIFLNHGCRDIVLHVSNPITIFQELENEIRQSSERFNERKYLFLLTSNSSESIIDLFQLQELNYVTDILIVIPEQLEEKTMVAKFGAPSIASAETYELVTHQFVGNNSFSEVIILDKWFSQNCSFLYSNMLYPDKISDQKGKYFRIAAFNYAPYSVIGRYWKALPYDSQVNKVRRRLKDTSFVIHHAL